MKKSLNLLALAFTALIIVGLSTGKIYARLTGTTGTAETCWGAAGAEVCVDTSGNWIPTTTNTQALGSSSLQWNTANIKTLTPGTGGIINGGGAEGLLVQTTNQIAARVDAVGTVFLAEERVAGSLVTNTYNLCLSTKAEAGTSVYLSVSTGVIVGGGAVAGAKCKN